MRNCKSYVDDLMGMFQFILTPHGLAVIIEGNTETALKSKKLYKQCDTMFDNMSKRLFQTLIQAISNRIRQTTIGEIE